MKIGVCIKQVPDTEARLRLAADGRWIDEEEMPFVINEGDEYAVEEAISIAEKSGGEAVVVSLGPSRVRESLRKALALGAHRAVHLADDAYQGGDAWSTARALAAVVEKEGFDLVLTGSQSNDAGFGSTGSLLAGLLGWPHAWLVVGLEVEDGGTAKVTREMEAGKNELLRLKLPAVIEVQAGINTPRYASLKGIMQAKRKELAELAPGELGLEAALLGAAGSKIEVLSVSVPEKGEGAQIIEGDAESAAQQLVEKLRTEARVL
jgi:electron transfer flavoprotein beta subunit